MNSNVLLAYHDSNKTITYKIGDFLIANGIEIYLISDQVPEKISERAKLVQNNGIVLVIADRNFQKSNRCMEILHFARDLKKEIFGINLFPDSFTPFGSLGAIINGTKGGFIDLIDPTNFELLKPIVNIVATKSLDEKNLKLKQQLPDFRSPTPTNPLLFTTGSKIDVLISVYSDSLEIANIVEEGIRSSASNITCEIEEVSSKMSSSRVCDCKVLIVIMSPGYEDSIKACLIVEKARSSGIHIVPVSKTREWKPQKWLGMIIAGVFFIRIVNKEKAYEKKYDTYPMKNLVFEVEKALNPKKTSNEIEKSLIDSLKKQIEECKAILGNNWPPEIKKRPLIVRKPVKVELQTPKADIRFIHTHYEVTRMELKPPPVFDDQGQPLRKKFDCMISYQWDIQDFVRDIYMDFHMRSLITWFDIWGFMEENSYNAMATAIECSRVIVVFLTEKYQKSDNCALEFKYAVFCGKPFVFILNDPNLKLEPWIEPHVKENPCFVVPTYKDITKLENNVPKIDIISQAIRAIGQAQPDFDVFDLSEDVIELKELLSSAKDAIDAQNGRSRFKQCDRCKKAYDESNSIGCKVHSSYYVGGKIIEGRWVCCNQQSKDSVGCREAPHTDAKRIWTRDSRYGTYTWEPH